MPVFLYKAQNTQGNQFNGEIEAKDKNEAESLLRRKHLVVESVKRKPMEIKIQIGSPLLYIPCKHFKRLLYHFFG